ncbi:MAG: universal stress protein [Acidimicrobiia bacterium]|nr:universal stress protein [Acidimicrobiia bacterium]
MLSEVLVPFNGSDDTIHAVEIGAGLARAGSRPLRVLAYTSNIEEPIHSRALFDVVDSIASRYALSPQITSIQSPRFLVDELLFEATRRSGSVLCIPSQGLGRKALVTGSLATEVLAAAPGPVVLIGPDCEAHLFEHAGPLVVALDGSSESERIIDVAHEWADGFRLPVEVVTVLDPKVTANFASALASGDVQESSYVASIARDSVLSENSPTFEILHGKPVSEILREANVRDASMIAIASHVPVGVDRLLHGSVLDEVVRHSPVPVIAINQNA